MELFDFDYQLEMYKPAAKRRWGYYAMPVLHRDRLIGKIDATADREAPACSGSTRSTRTSRSRRSRPQAVRRELKDLARWLELDLTLPR